MGETQVYKWWWDQTRKRVRQIKGRPRLSMPEEFVIPAMDEFGGYSSRARLEWPEGDNLCQMLRIDVDILARQIVEKDRRV